MAKRVVYISDDSDIIKRLVSWKAPFTVEITGSTRTVISHKTNTKYICSDSRMQMKTLGFIRSVKTFAGNCGIDKSPFTARDIDYYRFRDIMPGVYRDVIEVDVKEAYWRGAFDKGYISEEIYLKGQKIPKKDRLIAFGALATVKHRYYFDGESVKPTGIECNETTRSYFFDVARDLDVLMKSVFDLLEYSILWYWVDAFFLKKESQGHVRSQFYKHGLDCSLKYIDRIEVVMQGRTKVITCYMEDGEEKTFYIKPVSGIEKSANEYTDLVNDIRAEIARMNEEKTIINQFI